MDVFINIGVISVSLMSYGYSVDSECCWVIGLIELVVFVVLVVVVCWLVFFCDFFDILCNVDLDVVMLFYFMVWLKVKFDDYVLWLVLVCDLIELGCFVEVDM